MDFPWWYLYQEDTKKEDTENIVVVACDGSTLPDQNAPDIPYSDLSWCPQRREIRHDNTVLVDDEQEAVEVAVPEDSYDAVGVAVAIHRHHSNTPTQQQVVVAALVDTDDPVSTKDDQLLRNWKKNQDDCSRPSDPYL